LEYLRKNKKIESKEVISHFSIHKDTAVNDLNNVDENIDIELMGAPSYQTYLDWCNLVVDSQPLTSNNTFKTYFEYSETTYVTLTYNTGI